jgi:hypothetical protein
MISGQFLQMGDLPYAYLLPFVIVFPADGTKCVREIF